MTDKVKNFCFYNDRRGFIKELSTPSNEEGVYMSWYDMDTDIVHHLVCKDPNCNSDHSGRNRLDYRRRVDLGF